MDDIHQALTKQLRAQMRRRGWSANRLGDLAGLTGSAVAAIMRGEKSPTLRTLKRLADALDVKVCFLLEGL